LYFELALVYAYNSGTGILPVEDQAGSLNHIKE